MSKAILVMDMPPCCGNCDFVFRRLDGTYRCMLNKDCGNKVKFSEKPSWCPLKECPPYKEFTDYDDSFDDGFKSGYNACIDEILGVCDGSNRCIYIIFICNMGIFLSTT